MNVKIIPLSILLLLLSAPQLLAQNSEFKAVFLQAKSNNQTVAVTLKNGNVFSGTVTTVDEESAGVQTSDGVFNFRYDRIESVKIVKPGEVTSKWRENPSKNKLFIFQTGKLLDSGSGYYQNTYIFFSNFAYGISDHFSVDAGFSMIPGLGLDYQLYAIGAKVGTSISNTLYISGSLKYYTVYDANEGVSTLFGSATYTKNQLDLTASIGMGINSSDGANIITMLGGQYRVSDRFAFLSENIILPAGDGETPTLLSFGGRIISNKSALDLGFFAFAGDFIAPFVSFTIKF